MKKLLMVCALVVLTGCSALNTGSTTVKRSGSRYTAEEIRTYLYKIQNDFPGCPYIFEGRLEERYGACRVWWNTREATARLQAYREGRITQLEYCTDVWYENGGRDVGGDCPDSVRPKDRIFIRRY